MFFEPIQKGQIRALYDLFVHDDDRPKTLVDDTLRVSVGSDSNTAILLRPTVGKGLVKNVIQGSLDRVVRVLEGQDCPSRHV